MKWSNVGSWELTLFLNNHHCNEMFTGEEMICFIHVSLTHVPSSLSFLCSKNKNKSQLKQQMVLY